MKHFIGSIAIIVALAGCTAPLTRQPLSMTPPADAATSPVVRRPVPEVPAAPALSTEARRTAPELAASVAVPGAVAAPVFVPRGTLYVCVSERAGQRKETAIEFTPRVEQLCRKHPEMGPCQYEREICRRSGGRVFAANGQEITRLTEAEYNKRVMRVVFRGD